MIVYSKKIIHFIHEIKWRLREIISKELSLKVTGERFYDEPQKASYPIKIVIYNNKSMLGYFDAAFYELGFHEDLMYAAYDELQNVIRHELAHYITFINYGATMQPHGIEFRSLCERFCWGEEVSKATLCLEGKQAVAIEGSAIFRKVQKLLALATSSNQHEAEQAMIKSQELLLAHNIEAKYIAAVEDEKISLKRVMKQKRENAKMRSIARILETFFVNTVYTKAGGFIYLEICGSAVNIEIAEYVANVLQGELDKLWKQAQKSADLKGMVAKNSFFLGLAKGYCNKIQALRREYNSTTIQALLVIEKKLIDAKAMIYPRLSSSKSHARYCAKSSFLGEEMGRQLNINPAINRSSKSVKALIAYP